MPTSANRQSQLTVVTLVLFLLIPDVFANQLFVSANRADIVPASPECLPREVPHATFAVPDNPDGTFSFDESHDLADLVLRRNGNQHVGMVGENVSFIYPAALLACQFAEDIAKVVPEQSKQTFTAEFRDKDNVVLAFPLCVCAKLSSCAGMDASCVGFERAMHNMTSFLHCANNCPLFLSPHWRKSQTPGVRRPSRGFTNFN